jgi:hypothetical protein
MSPTNADFPLPIEVQFDFAGALFVWRGPAPYHFIALPDEVAGEVHGLAPLVTYGWGVIPVTAIIGDTEFTTSLFPRDAGYLLPVKDAVRKAEGLADGDEIAVLLTIRPA